MKKVFLAIAALFAFSTAQALPPYGFNMTQADATGSFFYGYYFIPPNETSDYIFMYRGTGIPSTNPLKMTAIGSGLSWDGTTLTASGTAQVNSDWNAVSGVAQILNKPTLTKSFAYTTKALNTCFQVSSTRDAYVNYAVDISTSLSLTTGQQGTVYLELFNNSGCTTGTQEVTRFVNGQTGTLTIGLALTQNVTGSLHGFIPAASYAKLRTENNTGTPTFTSRPGQEVLV